MTLEHRKIRYRAETPEEIAGLAETASGLKLEASGGHRHMDFFTVNDAYVLRPEPHVFYKGIERYDESHVFSADGQLARFHMVPRDSSKAREFELYGRPLTGSPRRLALSSLSEIEQAGPLLSKNPDFCVSVSHRYLEQVERAFNLVVSSVRVLSGDAEYDVTRDFSYYGALTITPRKKSIALAKFLPAEGYVEVSYDGKRNSVWVEHPDISFPVAFDLEPRKDREGSS